MLLILKQPDLGTALILSLIFVTICLLTKIRWQSLVTLVDQRRHRARRSSGPTC